ncbi:hypothetical protein P691DRAFT_679399 [Macrolepiota fuliginosa MF-IS2]|uniref:C2H2-type domain-containing protein n=1 Tax=Macrolepiota fuliginosa MF-IS2 TaxID=1400762 RepID=A0A9P6BXV1_9AGAR|nr:hypothetical protein P691DRAFT_679399 [Macrolepiota fuliginosa MF-IS2]
MTSNGDNEPEVIDLTAISESSSEEGDESTNGPFPSNDSDASEVEIDLNEETRSQLKNVINTVSAARLRQVLVELIDTEQAVEIALTREFVTLDRESHSIVPRWETCQNCKEDYDVNTEREEGECEFHPGELEVDEDGFPDHDEHVHGPMDTKENQRDFPENFIWSCCEGRGHEPGCVKDVHQSAVPRKRRRL